MLAVAVWPRARPMNWDRPSQDFGDQNLGSTSDPLQFVLVATCDAFNGFPGFTCASPPNGVHQYGAITTTGPFAIDRIPTSATPVGECR